MPRDGETIGEVMFRGNIVMKGYLKNQKATEEAFDGGWFHSGDLGVMHPDGYIQLKDRSKDIIISGGENISSIEVEDVLYNIRPCRPPPSSPSRRELGRDALRIRGAEARRRQRRPRSSSRCRQHLARFKVPRHVVFGDVPKTSTGKIQKFSLREMAKKVSP